jgi:hypothetical protein
MQRCYFLSLMVFASTFPIAAQGQDAERLEEYRQAATEGQEAFNRGEFAEARRLWQHARSVLPNPRVYRLLGRVADALDQHVEAVRMYRLALSAPDNGNPLTDARRAEVRDVLLPQAMSHVGEILLEITPADAAVTVDGVPADIHEGSLLLPVGSHALRVRRPGYADHERRIDVLARMREPLRIALAREGEGGASAEERPAERRPSSEPDLTGPLVVLGIAAAGLATFAVAGAMALGENSRLEDRCSSATTPTCGPVDVQDLAALTITADVGWIVGAAAAIAGLAWLGAALSQNGGGSEHAVRIAPWASANAAGIAIAGRMEVF